MTVSEAIAAMTPEEFREWREDYYLGIMASPFGQTYTKEGRTIYTSVPHGMSKHGVPKLRPEDD